MSSLNFAKRNVFDLTHERKFTCNMGDLVPVLCEEVVPGDKWFFKSDAVVRLTPLLAPIMHQVDVFIHFFYVPTRLTHDNWEKFITGGEDGKDNTVVPTVKAPSGGYGNGTLWDFIGCATGITGEESLAYPFRAYNIIWNDWYRDETLQTPATVSKADGLDTTTNMTLLKRCWKKDMFTNALPWPQRGDAVNLPLGTSAPVSVSGLKIYGNGKSLGLTDGSTNYGAKYSTGAPGLIPNTNAYNVNNGSGVSGGSAPGDNKAIGITTNKTNSGITGEGTGVADLTNATAATINSIRQAFQLQRWFEINAISGARYVEQILAHFHVKTGDARLQRSEFIGGFRSPIVISEVVQQSETNTTPQGTLTGHAFSANRSRLLKYFFPEHGYLIGLLSVMPKPSYQQGMRRMFNRRSRYDWYWPVFSHLGNQEIKNKEIYCQGDSVVDGHGEIIDEKPFGFTGRYDEYRYIPSTVHGEFKSTLNFWHLGRIFNNLPTLNSNFVTCDPAKRPFAVQNTDVCEIQILNQITAIRPMPRKGRPGLVDHA